LCETGVIAPAVLRLYTRVEPCVRVGDRGYWPQLCVHKDISVIKPIMQ